MDDFDFLERELPSIYPDWHETYMWVEDLHQAQDLMSKPRSNPFVAQQATFD